MCVWSGVSAAGAAFVDYVLGAVDLSEGRRRPVRALLGSIVLSFALVPPALARPVNLPGALAGGVEVCRPYRCFTTPADRETAIQVLSYQDGMANVRVGKETVVADPNDVVLKLKGCSLTLRSYLARRFCPGWKP